MRCVGVCSLTDWMVALMDFIDFTAHWSNPSRGHKSGVPRKGKTLLMLMPSVLYSFKHASMVRYFGTLRFFVETLRMLDAR